MFRHREVIIWIDLEHFKGIYEYKLLLLEYTRISHLLHNVFTRSAVLFNTFKTFNVDKRQKMSYMKLLIV